MEDNQVNSPGNNKIAIHVPQNLRFHGYRYTLVCRGLRSCLYRQMLGKETVGFEIFIIRVWNEKTINGIFRPIHEIWPGDETFGKTAWSYFTIEEAVKKFNFLEHEFKLRDIEAISIEADQCI